MACYLGKGLKVEGLTSKRDGSQNEIDAIDGANRPLLAGFASCAAGEEPMPFTQAAEAFHVHARDM